MNKKVKLPDKNYAEELTPGEFRLVLLTKGMFGYPHGKQTPGGSLTYKLVGALMREPRQNFNKYAEVSVSFPNKTQTLVYLDGKISDLDRVLEILKAFLNEHPDIAETVLVKKVFKKAASS